MQVQKVRVLAASVRKFLHRNAEGRIANLLANVRPADIANLLTELTDREQVAIVPILLRNRGNETVAETLSDLEVEVAAYILQQLSSPEISGILQESESDDAANFIAVGELGQQVGDVGGTHVGRGLGFRTGTGAGSGTGKGKGRGTPP